MPETPRSAPQAPGQPILAEAEAAHRMLLLSELQTALAALGTHSVLARNHRLVLRYNQIPCPPSGLTDPALHIAGPDCNDVATTNGITFSLASGPRYPADDPAAAATAIRHRQPTASQA
jgi:hypothetical protein